MNLLARRIGREIDNTITGNGTLIIDDKLIRCDIGIGTRRGTGTRSSRIVDNMNFAEFDLAALDGVVVAVGIDRSIDRDAALTAVECLYDVDGVGKADRPLLFELTRCIRGADGDERKAITEHTLIRRAILEILRKEIETRNTLGIRRTAALQIEVTALCICLDDEISRSVDARICIRCPGDVKGVDGECEIPRTCRQIARVIHRELLGIDGNGTQRFRPPRTGRIAGIRVDRDAVALARHLSADKIDAAKPVDRRCILEHKIARDVCLARAVSTSERHMVEPAGNLCSVKGGGVNRQPCRIRRAEIDIPPCGFLLDR